MIKHRSGDLFGQVKKGEYVVNPVNVVGVMGAGLAKQVQLYYPDACEKYYTACKNKLFSAGDVLLSEHKGIFVVHAATKLHWKNPSRIEWVDSILEKLFFLFTNGETVHLPPIGAGLGGLDKKVVLEKVLSKNWKCNLNLWNFQN